MKKYIYLILAMLLLVTTVSALDPARTTAYVNLSETAGNAIGMVNGKVWTNTNVDQNVAGIIGLGGFFDGTAEFTAADSSDWDTTAAAGVTVSVWVNSTDTQNTGLFDLDPANNDRYELIWDNDASDRVYFFVFDGTDGVLAQASVSGNSLDDGQWHMITGVRNLTDVLIYTDGVLRATTNGGSALDFAPDGGPSIGQQQASGVEIVGYLDEISFWNISLNAANITDLYNAGVGLMYPYVAGPGPSTRTIIQTFPPTFNETDDLFFTLNITDAIINNTRLQNATLNWLTENATFSANIEYNITGTIFFNVTINTTLLDLNNTLFLFNWTYNLTENEVRVFNETATENTTGVFAYFPTNFTLLGIVAETQEQDIFANFIKFLTNTTTDSVTVYFNATQVIQNLSPSPGVFNNSFFTPVVNQSNVDINITLNVSFTFEGKTVTRSVISNQNVTSITIINCSLTAGPEVILLYKNEDVTGESIISHLEVTHTTYATNKSVNTTFSAELNGADAYGFCFSFTGGTFFLDSIMLFDAPGFISKSWHFINATFEGNGTLNVTQLQLNDTRSTNVILTIVDQNNNPLAGWFVDVQRFYPADDLLRSTQVSKTSNNGEALIRVVANDEFYGFVIKDTSGQVRKVTTPAKIVQSELTIQLNLVEPFVDELIKVGQISATLTFNETTRIATYFFSDAQSIVASGRVIGYKNTPRGQIIVCQNSVSSASATLFCDTNNATGDLIFQGFIITNNPGDEFLVMDIFTFSPDLTLGVVGVFMWVLLTAMLTMMGIFNPVVAVGLTIISLIAGSMMGLISIPYAFIVIIVIVGGVIIVRLKA